VENDDSRGKANSFGRGLGRGEKHPAKVSLICGGSARYSSVVKEREGNEMTRLPANASLQCELIPSTSLSVIHNMVVRHPFRSPFLLLSFAHGGIANLGTK
jgi:hypothetical protein